MHVHTAISSPLLSAYQAPRRAAQPRTDDEMPDDRVALSPTARHLSQSSSDRATQPEGEDPESDKAVQPTGALQELSESDHRVITDLSQRDREVRTHEMAHLLAAGPHARGGPQYTYTTGPDGKRYAVAGAVPIDVSPVPGDPQATIQKAMTVRRAALAPAHPSGADMAIAAKASAMMQQASQELRSQPSDERTDGAEVHSAPGTPEPQADDATTATTSAAHVCGPNCPDHPIQAGLTNQNSSATPAAGSVATVLQSYQAPARLATMFSVMV